MAGATNEAEMLAAHRRAEARKAAEDNLSPEDKAFLSKLKDRWFALGKTEDFALVKRMFLDSRGSK